MRKIALFILLSVILASPCMAAGQPGVVADDGTFVDLPRGYQVEKKDDLSNAVLSRLFGASWDYIVGGQGDPISRIMNELVDSTFDGKFASAKTSYAGLIVSILGVLNAAAMAYVAVAIIYMWGIFAVTTAHEGNKLGGSIYNSLWVPVRHACAFSLTVPVLNGLSLMQVAIIACMGLSINFANAVWDASGKYILEHAHTGIINSSTPMFENEARNMIPTMFEAAVIQQIEVYEKNSSDIEKSLDIAGVEAARRRPPHGAVDVEIKRLDYIIPGDERFHDLKNFGAFYVKRDQDKGEAFISVVPPAGVPASNFGGIRIDYPTLEKTKEGGLATPQPGSFGQTQYESIYGDFSIATYSEPKDKYYQLKKELAEKRIAGVENLWKKIYFLAARYLASRSSTGGAGCVTPLKDKEHPMNMGCINEIKNEALAYTNDAIEQYLREINAETSALVKKAIEDESGPIKDALRKAIDADPDTGSKHGWMSAGLFTFMLASLQKKIDDTVLGQIVTTAPERAGNLKRDSSNPVWNFFGGKDNLADGLGDQSKLGLQRAGRFAASAMGSTHYIAESGAVSESSKLTELGMEILKRFLFSSDGVGTTNRGGMLGTVLNYFTVYDPIVAVQSIGDRLLDIVPAVFVAGTLADFISGSFIGAGAASIITIAGLVFAFVVPITPVVFWMKALLSWLFMVVEAMVAAPFWACTHALPEGPGFAGQHARRGYLMLLDIIIRPCLLVLGAVFSIAMIQAAGWMFSVIFNTWFVNIAGSFITIGIMADITFSILVVSTMYYVSYTIFTKGVNYLPERVLYWCGGTSGSGLRDEEHGTTQILAAGAVMSKAQSGIQNGSALAGKGLAGAKSAGALAWAKLSAAAHSKSEIGQITKA